MTGSPIWMTAPAPLFPTERLVEDATAFIVLSFTDGEDLRIIENSTIHLVRIHLVNDPNDVEAIAQAGAEPPPALMDAYAGALDALAALNDAPRQAEIVEQAWPPGLGRQGEAGDEPAQKPQEPQVVEHGEVRQRLHEILEGSLASRRRRSRHRC